MVLSRDVSDNAYRPFDVILPSGIGRIGVFKMAMATPLTTKERALRLASEVLDRKRKFLSDREVQFLNSLRVSGVQPDDLTGLQMKTIGDIGKRLGLVE